MSTVAVIGPDGAGKTTVCRRLAAAEPHRFRYLYMGASRSSSNVLLPTTRLAAAARRRFARRRRYEPSSRPSGGDSRRARAGPSGRLSGGSRSTRENRASRLVRGLKSTASTLNQMAEESYRQLLSWEYQRRGFIVLYDRHFVFDYTGSDVAPRNDTPARRMHVWWLRHLYPRPDLALFLDVPTEILHRRRREELFEALEERRLAHLEQLRSDRTMIRIDASQPLAAVVDAARTAIEQRLESAAEAPLQRRAPG